MSKNKLTLILMTLLTVSALGGVMAYAQVVDENMVAAETLLSLLEASEGEVTSLFETIVNDGGIVPEDAQEALEEAQQLRAEAQGLFDEGSYLECVEKATEALNKYGEAITEATPEEPEEMGTQVELVEEETEKMVVLTTAIEKARARIVKLEEIADNLDALSIDTEDARLLLVEAEGILDDIPENILLEDVDEVEDMLSEAKSLIGEATGILKNKGEPKKQEKIQHFIAQTKHHVGQLEKKMNKILAKMGSSEENVLKLQTQFGGVFTELEGIDTKDGLKEAVTQLKWLVKETKQIGKGDDDEESLFEDETIEAINSQTEMETLIEKYRVQVMELEAGEEQDELLAMLIETEELLAQAEDALISGDEDLAEELSDEAEDILDAFDDMFDEAEEKQEHKGKSGEKFDELIDDDEEEKEDKGKSGEKFIEKLEEVNERIVELESHIEGIEDDEERASYEARLEDVKAKVDEAVSDEDLEEIEDLLEILEDELDIKDSHSNDEALGVEQSDEDPEESDG